MFDLSFIIFFLSSFSLPKDSDVSAADPNDILKNMKVSNYK